MDNREVIHELNYPYPGVDGDIHNQEAIDHAIIILERVERLREIASNYHKGAGTSLTNILRLLDTGEEW